MTPFHTCGVDEYCRGTKLAFDFLCMKSGRPEGEVEGWVWVVLEGGADVGMGLGVIAGWWWWGGLGGLGVVVVVGVWGFGGLGGGGGGGTPMPFF